MIHVFKHFGRTCGAGAGTGGDDWSGTLLEAPGLVGTGVAAGATHLVQIVEVKVLKIVDVVITVEMLWLPAVVNVCVTGQIVTEAVVLRIFDQF